MKSVKMLQRLDIIQRVSCKDIVQKEASEILGISERQVRRIIKRVREEGSRGIVHRLTWMPSNRTKNAAARIKE